MGRSPVVKTVILTATGAGTVTLPADFDPLNNQIWVLGAGTDGSGGGITTALAAGGGGQCSTLINVPFPAGSTQDFQIGVRNGGGGTPVSPADGDTWIGTATTLFAQGATGGSGGSYNLSGSWTRYSGGNSGSGQTSSDGGAPGGGGAGGPNGHGGNGGSPSPGFSAKDTGGGGGGGANGGSSGANNDPANGRGGSGGNNRVGAGGGPGGVNLHGTGGAGSAGGGGGGGGSSDTSTGGGKGGRGSLDAVWGPTYGPGGGGGGGGGPWSTDKGGDGGDAGGYGGGGGAGAPHAGGPATAGGLGTSGLIVITYGGSSGGGGTLPSGGPIGRAPRVDVVLRIATPTVIRVWSGQVRDIALPAGGAETTDGAIYQAMGLLTGLPQLSAAINGDAERVEFSVSGVAVTGEVAAIAAGSAGDIRGVAVDVGLILFDADWQLVPPVYWVWSGTADSLTVERSGDVNGQVRALKLSCGNVFTGRRRSNLTFFTDIDQRRRSSDDTFFSEVSKLQSGTTKVWGVG